MSGRSMVWNPDAVCVFLFVCVYMCLLYMQHIFTAYSIGKHLLEFPVSNLQFRRLSLSLYIYIYSCFELYMHINILISRFHNHQHQQLFCILWPSPWPWPRAMSISVHVALLSGRSIDLTISQESTAPWNASWIGQVPTDPMTDPNGADRYIYIYANIKGLY